MSLINLAVLFSEVGFDFDGNQWITQNVVPNHSMHYLQ